MGTTVPEIKKYIDQQNALQPFEKHQVFDLAIELKQTGKVIGILTMIPKHHRKGEIGYGLGIDYRGQGYATEAASSLIMYLSLWISTGYKRLQVAVPRHLSA